MKASDLLVKCLENEGVRYIFGIPGEENIDILDSLLDSKIQFIPTRHEQGAAFMADVYGRLTGKAGCVFIYTRPWSYQPCNGCCRCQSGSSTSCCYYWARPVSIVCTRNHINTWTPLLYLSPSQNGIPWYIQPILSPRLSGRHLNLPRWKNQAQLILTFPEDVAKADLIALPIPLKDVAHTPYPTEETLGIAAKLISDANYPVVLAGNGVLRSRASESLTNFAVNLNIPVATTFMGKGAISDDCPLSLLSIGLRDDDHISCGFDQADLIIAIGYDLVEYPPYKWNPHKSKKILHIDVTSSEVDAYYNVDMEVIGKISETLDHLSGMVRIKETKHIINILRNSVTEECKTTHDDTSFPMKPQKILCVVREVLKPDDILISDVGAHKLWISRMYPVYKPNTCIISNGFASMGIALPGAIAAKLVYPERQVIAIMGDGGFLMNSQEIETATRLGLSFVSLIFHDNSYGVIKSKQLNFFGRSAFVDFSNPDFVKYAESFGAKGYRVESANDLKPILQDAIKQRGVSVIDCPVDYSENIFLTQRMSKLSSPNTK